ncbi:cytochrome c oxidase subunit III [Candidatus Koribacter versatilis Ellin345]|uniref:Cytochrome c oxidase subunit III n=1 Tax=Koribacter versatilis (strain Ellin345) TaxID=204669 RepID=Q1IUK5_KORVE|nr:cytochrome c oxidase subunit 3 [Candidatus Koribacter versatilis]ABF39445.1 cytochrome c oxidase subunit III [Candidatus Koribacter versatilis Ellin345]
MSQADIAQVGHGPAYEAPPFAIPSKKLVMWLFIISDAVTFGAMLYGYGYLRNASSDWPTPFKFSPSIVNVMIMTFVLITSSLTMLIGVRKAQSGDRFGAINWTFITVLLGLVFAGLHIREWIGLIHEGVTLSANPWGSKQFGALFFSITGLHLTHVFGGVIALTVVALGFKRGRYKAADIEIWGLYWHFVDLVWMFVVPLVYLLNLEK